jgi:hypothetical protein
MKEVNGHAVRANYLAGGRCVCRNGDTSLLNLFDDVMMLSV